MPQFAEAEKFCKQHSLPDKTGWVVFMAPDGLHVNHIPFAWAMTLPHCFQPFRCSAVNMETFEQVKALGLGGRQRWEVIE